MTLRVGAILATIVAGVALLLGAAWVMDPSAARERAAQKEGAEFSYELPPEEQVANSDILIGCSEHTIEAPNAEFAKWKDLRGAPLALPGGPLALAHLDDVQLSEQFKPAQRAAVEVLKRHSPRKIVVVAHTMCLYYDTIAAWNNSLPQVRERQVQDMHSALHLLREWFPQAEISGYLAEEENRTLFYRPVTQK